MIRVYLGDHEVPVIKETKEFVLVRITSGKIIRINLNKRSDLTRYGWKFVVRQH